MCSDFVLVQADAMLISVFWLRAVVQFCRAYLACPLAAYLFPQFKEVLMHANYFPLEKEELEVPAQVETICIPVPTGVRRVQYRVCVMP